MLRVVIDSRLHVNPDDLPEEAVKALQARFTHKNPKRDALKRAGVPGWWSEPVAIVTWGVDGDGWMTLPRGGMSALRQVAVEHGLTLKVRDLREPGAQNIPYAFPDSTVEQWPHQIRIVDACATRQNCLVKSGTGSGKTTALISLFAKLKVPTLILVHSNALADQWIRRAKKELGLNPKDIGSVSGGKLKLRPLTIATTASFRRHVHKPEIQTFFGAVFADEVHLFAAKTFMQCIDPLPAKYRIGVSDDHRRKDRMEFLIEDLFGDVAVKVDDGELVAARHVLDVECMIVPTEFRADWYGATAEKKGDDDKSPDFDRLVKEMAADPARQELIRGIIATEMKAGRQILVLCHQREHVQALGQIAASHGPAGYLVGGPDYKAEFKRTVDGMTEGTIRAGVGTFQACGTGIDIPGIEVAIAATPVLSNRQRFRQGRGRACRAPAGKTVARFYVLWDQHVHGIRHVENAAAWNPTTFVWDGRWVPVREWLKKIRT